MRYNFQLISYKQLYYTLPMQPLGPPLNPIKLYLWRLLTFSTSKLSGLYDHGFGYNSGIWWVVSGDIRQIVPFGRMRSSET